MQDAGQHRWRSKQHFLEKIVNSYCSQNEGQHQWRSVQHFLEKIYCSQKCLDQRRKGQTDSQRQTNRDRQTRPTMLSWLLFPVWELAEEDDDEESLLPPKESWAVEKSPSAFSTTSRIVIPCIRTDPTTAVTNIPPATATPIPIFCDVVHDVLSTSSIEL